MNSILCPTCKEKYFVEVSINNLNYKFYSCANEKCEDYAELFMMLKNEYVKVSDMINGVDEIKNEFTKITESRI
jgi:hypothetical protein